MSELDLHPEPERLEAYLEDALPDAERALFESHLLGCAQCRAELEEWRALFGALESLPEIEPSPGFVDRVMAQVTVTIAPARAQAQVRWLPRTNRGWALMAAFLALPIAGIAGAVAWLVTQPWATAISLTAVLSYGVAMVSSALAWSAAEVESLLVNSGMVRALADALRQFRAAAGVAGLGLAAASFCLAALASIWILYRNLIRNSNREPNYAPYTL